jgi:hypothetical protein
VSREYKERRQRGGVYAVTCARTGRYLVGHAADLESVRNRFRFSVTTGTAFHPKLRQEWAEQGGEAFALEVLEELEQGPEQSQAAFVADLVALEQLCRARLDASKEY